MPNAVAYLDESTASGWERTLYAFLAEKERRSGSLRTVQSYPRMLHHFFDSAGKAPDGVTSQDVSPGPTALASQEGSRARSRSAPVLLASAASIDSL